MIVALELGLGLGLELHQLRRGSVLKLDFLAQALIFGF